MMRPDQRVARRLKKRGPIRLLKRTEDEPFASKGRLPIHLSCGLNGGFSGLRRFEGQHPIRLQGLGG